MTNQTSGISVIICAYTEERWQYLVEAIESVQQQSLSPQEIILVIDHNPSLLLRAYSNFIGVRITENLKQKGLSGARNTGIEIAGGDIIAFLDDDAKAAPNWLEEIDKAHQNPEVLGVGGEIDPLWQKGKPGWFPEEFNWVVGCTYIGMPKKTAQVRNLIGCNMAFRRKVFEVAGGFRDGIGRIGKRPLGCEETELCIRAAKNWPDMKFIYEPKVKIRHQIPTSRSSWKYFYSRCYAEGLSKALVSHLVGKKDALSSELTYSLRTLPLGVFKGFKDSLLQKNFSGIGRALSIIVGLGTTIAGYATGHLHNLMGKQQQWDSIFVASTRLEMKGQNNTELEFGA